MLIAVVTATSQRRPEPTPEAKPIAARLMVQATYEENYLGITNHGNAQGKLLIKFEAARWLMMGTNEVGNAEFSDLGNAPASSVSGLVSYEGRVKSSAGGGDSYEATSSFAGPLAGDDVVLSVPEYTDTGKDFKIRVFVNPKLKGKCSLVSVRSGETSTSTDCRNSTYFITASSPIQLDDNQDNDDDLTRAVVAPKLAGFGIELDIEPDVAAASSSGPAGEAGVYAWRGAVGSGSKEAGFKILLNKTKELASDDKRGKSVRVLNFIATIVPGMPK
jgi:hypothetical protein